MLGSSSANVCQENNLELRPNVDNRRLTVTDNYTLLAEDTPK